MSADRNLLIAALAVQLNLMTPEAMQEVFAGCKSLAELDLLRKFQSDGLVTDSEASFLEALYAEQVKLHNGSVEQCLASLSAFNHVRKATEGLSETAIEATVSAASNLQPENQAPVEPEGFFGREPVERFRVLRPHASGGLGEVSVAEDLEVGREVALKTIRQKYSSDSESRLRFTLEAEVTGQLEHPGIVPVYGLGSTPSGCPFYVMKFIRGRSLAEAIDEFHSSDKPLSVAEKRMTLRALIQRLIDVANAVDYAHSRGVLHRDLKPGNIMLGKYGETIVVDWGLAKTLTSDEIPINEDQGTIVPLSSESASGTQLGAVVGTLAYMSPEQAEGRLDELCPATDVYCLGATLYRLLSGRKPGQGTTMREVRHNVAKGNIPSLRSISKVDSRIAAICGKAMSTTISDRYQTARSLAEDLELYLADEPVTAYRESIFRRSARWLRRNQIFTSSLATALLLATVGAVIFSTAIGKKNKDLNIANSALERKTKQLANEKQIIQQTRDDFSALAFNVLGIAETKLTRSDPIRQELMESSVGTLEKLKEANPNDQQVLRQLIRAYRYLANQMGRTGKSRQAITQMKKAGELSDVLISDTQADADILYGAGCYRDLVGQLRQQGKFKEAVTASQNAQSLLDQVQQPQTSGTKLLEVALLNLTVAGMHEHTLDFYAGIDAATRSLDSFEQLKAVRKLSSTEQVTQFLVIAWHGKMAANLARKSEAEGIFQEGLKLTADAFAANSKSANNMYAHARMNHWAAESDVALDSIENRTAERAETAIRILTRLHEALPERTGFHADLAQTHQVLALIQHARSEGSAIDHLNTAVQLMTEVCEKDDDPTLAGYLGLIYKDRAAIHDSSGNTQEAERDRELALDSLQKAVEACPESNRLRKFREELQLAI